MRASLSGLALACLCAPYLFRIGDVPLVKIDELFGAQASLEIWQNGRFALPAYQGHLAREERTFFHPPVFYLVTAPIVGGLAPSPFSVRLGPTLFAILSFGALHAALRRALTGRAGADALAVLGVAIAAWNPLTFALARHARPETWVALLGVAAVALAAGGARRALASGLVSGVAVASHYFALVIPVAIGAWLVSRRAWRCCAAYALGGFAVAIALGAWIAPHWSDFVAENTWRWESLIGESVRDHVFQSLAAAAGLALDHRVAPVWIADALLLATLAPGAARPLRRPVLALLACLHLVLFLAMPRKNPYYLIAIVYACAGAIPLVAALHLETGAAAPRRLPRGVAAALACGLLVQAAGVFAVIWRDRGADYAATFGPLRAAVDRADPERRAVTLGSEIHFLAFWDRPFLVRDNPSLWTVAPGEIPPGALVRRWRERGVRFVLASSLIPDPEPFGPLSPDLDRALVERLRAGGRVIARVPSRWYGEIHHTHEPRAHIEVIDLEAPAAGRPVGASRVDGDAPTPDQTRGRFARRQAGSQAAAQQPSIPPLRMPPGARAGPLAKVSRRSASTSPCSPARQWA
jgi:hypothetical protein